MLNARTLRGGGGGVPAAPALPLHLGTKAATVPGTRHPRQLSPVLSGDLRNRNPRTLPKPTQAAAAVGRGRAEFRAFAQAQVQTTSCQFGCRGFGGFCFLPTIV